MADVASILDSWSTTVGSNTPNGTTVIGAGLDDNLRQIQAVVRELAARNSIASASTTDLSTINETFITISGVTTITALGTLTAGMYKVVTFSGILTLTHNGTSLILPSAANITTAVNDSALMLSLGSGNWQCLGYWKADGTPVVVAAATGGMVKNYLINGTFSIAQRGMPTADNAYCIDRWRLMLGAANAATVTQDTASVPAGAKYACKLVVGAGVNNKFGIFQVLENVNCAELAGKTVSILVPLKATAGLTDGTGKIRIGILQWTGTADSVSVTPISAWNGEGTNPTLIASWAFANTPAAQSVTTSWADYSVINIALSASATNIGVLIWSDDKANTQTTDVLQIGGYVTLAVSAVAPSAQTRGVVEELALCQRYCQKTFPLATAPAQNAGTTGVEQWCLVAAEGLVSGQVDLSTTTFQNINFFQRMRAAPTIVTYNPSAANAQPRLGGSDCNGFGITTITERGFSFTYGNGSAANLGALILMHYLATAEL